MSPVTTTDGGIDVLASGTDQLILPSASTLISPTATQLVIFVTESASATSSPSTKSLLVIIIPAVVGGVVFAVVLFLVLLWYLRRKRAAGLPLQFQYERQSSFLARQGEEEGVLGESRSQDSLGGWEKGGGAGSNEPRYFIDPSLTFQSSSPPPLPLPIDSYPTFPPPSISRRPSDQSSSPSPFSTSYQTLDSPVSPPQLYIQPPHHTSLSSLSIPTYSTSTLPSQSSLSVVSYNPSANLSTLSPQTQLPVPPSPCQLAREDPFAEYQGAPQVVATPEDAKASSTGTGRKRAGSKSSMSASASASAAGHGTSAWGSMSTNSRVSRTSSSVGRGGGSSEEHGNGGSGSEGSFVMIEFGVGGVRAKEREEEEGEGVGYAV